MLTAAQELNGLPALMAGSQCSGRSERTSFSTNHFVGIVEDAKIDAGEEGEDDGHDDHVWRLEEAEEGLLRCSEWCRVGSSFLHRGEDADATPARGVSIDQYSRYCTGPDHRYRPPPPFGPVPTITTGTGIPAPVPAPVPVEVLQKVRSRHFRHTCYPHRTGVL